MSGAALKNPGELPARLELASPGRLLLVDAPPALVEVLLAARAPDSQVVFAESGELSGVKETFDSILLWREDRVGSRSVLDAVVRRLEPAGALWIVIAMKKVRGPKTAAAHRLELPDLAKGLGKYGLSTDKEVRVTSWHVAHRFVSYSR